MLADMGVAVRDWVSYYGAVVNVHSDLTLAGGILGPLADVPGARATRTITARLGAERLIEIVAANWAFERTDLFFNHPMLADRATRRRQARMMRMPIH